VYGVLTALTLPLWPAAAALTALHPRLSRHLGERLGWSVAPVQPGSVWIHAASVGEVRAVAGLIDDLPRPVLITTDTDTGRAAARRLATPRPGVYVSACPLDHLLAHAPLWAEARPRVLCFVEGTFWPALAHRARAMGVPVWRVAAKASGRTRRWPRPLLRALWSATTVAWARDPEQAAFLRGLHDDVRVLGDPKAWAPAPAPALRHDRPVVVGASTRPGDERRLLAAVRALDPRPRLLLAPRHLSRVDGLERWLVDEGCAFVRRSRLSSEVPPDVDVILGDTHGDLARDLVGAAAAFIGGTFDPTIGGHSPWEAAAAGVPVVAGPHGDAQGGAFAEVDAVRVGPDDLARGLEHAMARRTPRSAPPGPPAAWRAAIASLGGPAPEASPRPWAWPLVPVVGLGGALLRLRRRHHFGVPVLGVGSANARGPGRTSLVRGLVRILSARGHRGGVVLRGYRRRSGRGVFVSADPADVDRLGDEGAVHARAGATVAAGPDRVRGLRALVERGVTVVVLDDGVMRGDIALDLCLLVVDARFPRARGPLPVGERRPGREPWRTVLVATHTSERWPAPAGAFGLVRRPGPWMRGEERAPAPVGPVVAFAGIGRPVDFFDSLEVEVASAVALPDHAPIDGPTFAALQAEAAGRPLVTTGKDAARLSVGARSRVWWRDVEVDLPDVLLRLLPEPAR